MEWMALLIVFQCGPSCKEKGMTAAADVGSKPCEDVFCIGLSPSRNFLAYEPLELVACP